jgi:hypothetical protein
VTLTVTPDFTGIKRSTLANNPDKRRYLLDFDVRQDIAMRSKARMCQDSVERGGLHESDILSVFHVRG